MKKTVKLPFMHLLNLHIYEIHYDYKYCKHNYNYIIDKANYIM